MMLTTTLNKIRDKNPCESGWVKLLKHLDKTKSDDEELTFKTILESNGLDDALWCLQCVDGYDKEMRLFAVWCARQVEHLDKTGVSKTTNDVSERYANEQATTAEELSAASDAAWDAVWNAARDAARYAAWAAAGDAVRDAARCAARAAARCAARAAAGDAVRDAARCAARCAAEAAQKEQFIKQFCTEE